MQKLGQHFLKDGAVLRAIGEAVEPRPSETIIEIGPGHGELTKVLREANSESHIIAIEKDANLGELLQKKFAGDEYIEIVKGDALELLPDTVRLKKLKAATYVVVGNIPYYITGRLLRTLGELNERPSRIVLTIQKEVAERICAEPPRMNRLAAIVQFWAEPKILRIVSRSAFKPEPDVDSAIIVLSTRGRASKTVGFPTYTEIVRKLFAQPRKTILNNLRATIPAQDVERALRAANVVPEQRPQDLTIEAIVDIAAHLRKT